MCFNISFFTDDENIIALLELTNKLEEITEIMTVRNFSKEDRDELKEMQNRFFRELGHRIWLSSKDYVVELNK